MQDDALGEAGAAFLPRLPSGTLMIVAFCLAALAGWMMALLLSGVVREARLGWAAAVLLGLCAAATLGQAVRACPR